VKEKHRREESSRCRVPKEYFLHKGERSSSSARDRESRSRKGKERVFSAKYPRRSSSSFKGGNDSFFTLDRPREGSEKIKEITFRGMRGKHSFFTHLQGARHHLPASHDGGV